MNKIKYKENRRVLDWLRCDRWEIYFKYTRESIMGHK